MVHCTTHTSLSGHVTERTLVVVHCTTHKSIGSCHRTDTCSGSLPTHTSLSGHVTERTLVVVHCTTHKSIGSCHRTDTCSGSLLNTHKSIRSCHINSLLGRQASYFTPCCGLTILRWQPSVNYIARCLH